jgi:hypothetical protein
MERRAAGIRRHLGLAGRPGGVGESGEFYVSALVAPEQQACVLPI